MRYEITIAKDGKKQVNVLDRQDQNCEEIHRITTRLGTVESEEITGPDCDKVHEINQ